jgi:hypothetical protein
LLTGDDPLMPDAILRSEVLRRHLDQADAGGSILSKVSLRSSGFRP